MSNKTYHIKSEYFDLWAGHDETRNIDEIVITEDDIAMFAQEWETTVDELKKQLIED